MQSHDNDESAHRNERMQQHDKGIKRLKEKYKVTLINTSLCVCKNMLSNVSIYYLSTFSLQPLLYIPHTICLDTTISIGLFETMPRLSYPSPHRYTILFYTDSRLPHYTTFL